jgi:hypothetical protein
MDSIITVLTQSINADSNNNKRARMGDQWENSFCPGLSIAADIVWTFYEQF